MRAARRFVISGRVQGVGFRFFAHDCARREGLTGSVRNLNDGRVEAIAEGEATALDRFEAALWQGPSHARVSQIEVDVQTPTGRTDTFRII